MNKSQQTWEHRQLIKEKIMNTIRETDATMEDVEYLSTWLMQKKERDKKHFLKNIHAKEVLSDDD